MNPAWVTCGAAAVTAVAAACGGFAVRGSTAVPASLWAVLAALSLAGEAAAVAMGGLAEPAERSAVRVVVVALGVCPAMSLLGAKRPQHGVWQFIVVTLACVLSMPAVTAVLVRPGSMPDLHLLERCFLPLLVVIGWLNFIATQRSVAALLVAAGQVSLMWAFLPLVGDGEALPSEVEAAFTCVLASGAVLAVVQAGWWPAASRGARGPIPAIETPILALRETLGAAWTLRVIERFNAVAIERSWPCRLRFNGLSVDLAAQDDRWEAEAVRCMRSLLRRFASPAWIERNGGS
jgi:hypothetical protein